MLVDITLLRATLVGRLKELLVTGQQVAAAVEVRSDRRL